MIPLLWVMTNHFVKGRGHSRSSSCFPSDLILDPLRALRLELALRQLYTVHEPVSLDCPGRAAKTESSWLSTKGIMTKDTTWVYSYLQPENEQGYSSRLLRVTARHEWED